MPTDTLPKQFLDCRNKRLSTRQIQTRERDVRRLETASQRRAVVCFRSRQFLILDMGSPEFVGFDGLGCAVGGDLCVGPGGGSVAVEEGPVALYFVSDYFSLGMGQERE